MEFIDRSAQAAFRGALPYGSHGDSVRLKKIEPTSSVFKEPDHLYLIYIGMSDTLPGELVVRHIEMDIDPANVADKEDALATSCKNGVYSKKNFEPIIFKKASYFTIVLDEDGWDFYYPDHENPEPDFFDIHDPIMFIREKSLLIYENGKWKKDTDLYTLNRTFYESELVDVRVAGVVRKAVRCINFFVKNAAGEPVGKGDIQPFGFNILLQVPYAESANPLHKSLLIIDPDGQNQGPDGP